MPYDSLGNLKPSPRNEQSFTKLTGASRQSNGCSRETSRVDVCRLSLDDLSEAAPAAGAMVNKVLMKSLALLLSNNLDSIVD